MTLKEVLEMWCAEESYDLESLIENGRKKLFDFKYPVFDENYRAVLERNFIRNFFMREIGFETEGLFKFNLQTWLMINMEYYNQYFKSNLIEYNPLENTNTKTNHNRNNNINRNDNRNSNVQSKANDKTDATAKQTNNSNSKDTRKENGQTNNNDFNRNVESDTPENRLQITTNDDGTGVIEYASKIQENKNIGNQTNSVNAENNSNSTNNQNASSNSTSEAQMESKQDDNLTSEIKELEDYLQYVVGKTGTITYQEMIMKYRESILNIQRMMFKDMEQLFMLLY